MTQRVWMVRAGNNNELAKTAESKSAVAIGWSEMGDMTTLKSRDDFKERYVRSYPDHSASRVGVNTGQVYYFFREMEVGDYVLTYDKALRQILIGRVDGPVEYRTDLFGASYLDFARNSAYPFFFDPRNFARNSGDALKTSHRRSKNH